MCGNKKVGECRLSWAFGVGFRRWLRPDGSGPVDGRSFGRLGGGGRRHEGREVVAEVLGLSATPETVDELSARLGNGESKHAHLLKNVSRKLNPMVTSLCSPSSPPPVFLPCLPAALGATSISTQGGSMSFACWNPPPRGLGRSSNSVGEERGAADGADQKGVEVPRAPKKRTVRTEEGSPT